MLWWNNLWSCDTWAAVNNTGHLESPVYRTLSYLAEVNLLFRPAGKLLYPCAARNYSNPTSSLVHSLADCVHARLDTLKYLVLVSLVVQISKMNPSGEKHKLGENREFSSGISRQPTPGLLNMCKTSQTKKPCYLVTLFIKMWLYIQTKKCELSFLDLILQIVTLFSLSSLSLTHWIM